MICEILVCAMLLGGHAFLLSLIFNLLKYCTNHTNYKLVCIIIEDMHDDVIRCYVMSSTIILERCELCANISILHSYGYNYTGKI